MTYIYADALTHMSAERKRDGERERCGEMGGTHVRTWVRAGIIQYYDVVHSL